MKKIIVLLLLCPLLASQADAQFSQAARDSIRKLTQIDYKLMLNQLGIEASQLRPGPSGIPSATNAANTDESKARTYKMLPDALIFNNGDTVRTAEEWETGRRGEIVEYFDREIYGRVPLSVPEVTWILLSVKDTVEGDYPVNIKHLVGRVDNSSFPEINLNMELIIGTPSHANEPVPVIAEFGFNWTPAQLKRFAARYLDK